MVITLVFVAYSIFLNAHQALHGFSSGVGLKILPRSRGYFTGSFGSGRSKMRVYSCKLLSINSGNNSLNYVKK